MTILVTAASGQLGRLVVDALLARGAHAADIVAGARTPAKLDDLAARGVAVVELDYDRPGTISAALDGVDRVLLISGSEPGTRLAGHLSVVAAAEAAGVARLVYTSAPQVTTFDYVLAPDHRATEEAIVSSGIPYVILRNGWYTENFAHDLAVAAETGVIASAVGGARVASASRADYAEAAAVVLLDDGHLGRTYELAGDVAWDHLDLAAAASAVLGRDVAHLPLSREQLVARLDGAGVTPELAGYVLLLDDVIGTGVLGETDGTLSRLIGRPTTPLEAGLRALATERAASI
ncbi:NAD(P)H-binding protein [Microbacterium ulmi]|uniref:NAD(P)H-binding protein n=1 Tax=Microbacterium ulmi TaxID=179095 RepID=A0A7Y2M2H2_9MICO|nr:NAD(P)H-binding protein [Microbacterium ulmi]NII68634.1 NAD(P)H dehydrogenase (quinone) [Microbacterium ulmi]NNH04804.1 NAD(P)H-binding protein [Microbacterium ulmi]